MRVRRARAKAKVKVGGSRTYSCGVTSADILASFGELCFDPKLWFELDEPGKKVAR